MKLRFLSLASGSSGNCYYFGTDEYGILLDAGISLRTIKKVLKENHIGLEQIMAVFVTHDHTDHIKAVGGLGEKYGIPIFATESVHNGINNSRFIGNKLYTSRSTIKKGETVLVKEFRITAFDVPHDASDCAGYLIQYKDQRCVLATDMGRITETAAHYIRTANHLIIEANYDEEMLNNGNYPAFLKERIRNGNGHLCNKETASFLADNFDLHIKNIWLCHLSKDNNRPDLAYEAVETAFNRCGIRIGFDVNVTALKRTTPSELYILE
ncbi:MAG: MBL fold metallo-hydrolase [Dysgonamonadaceae bacterium]|jgi:phosphoribosyl 1,2-cyclic phosphodiesterase|nr:MBL fold metallo-hydrolase [Dysgonamonadaceae bacterium]